MDTRDILLALDIYCEHDWDKMYNKIVTKECDFLDNKDIMLRIEAEKYAILAKGYKVAVLNDMDLYPEKIFHSAKPPFVIYYKGDIETVSERYSYKSPEEDPKRMFIE